MVQYVSQFEVNAMNQALQFEANARNEALQFEAKAKSQALQFAKTALKLMPIPKLCNMPVLRKPKLSHK